MCPQLSMWFCIERSLVLGFQWRLCPWLQSSARGCCSTEGRCDGLKPISELCNLSLFTSAEGEYSAAVQITQPLNSFVWLASIQACEACPTQSTAIVRLKMLQQLSDRLLYYMAISPSLQRSLSHFMLFLVLMCEPLIRLQLDDSPPYFSCLSFPCFPLLLPSPSAIPYYAVLSLIFLMTLSIL